MMTAENCRPIVPTMLKNRSRKALDSCTIMFDTINLTIKVGDNILLKAPKGRGPYVAEVVEISADRKGKNVRMGGRWYYRPEDARGGRRNFHGANELFRSGHVDFQMPESVDGKCKVHSFREYLSLDEVEETDYFCRMDYDPNSGEFYPRRIEVFCICDLPWNPDHMMVKCDDCSGWYHPECLGFSREEAEKMDRVVCNICEALNDLIEGQTSDLGQEHANKRPRSDAASPSSSEISAATCLPRY